MTRRHEQLEEVIRRTLQESLRKGIADPRVRGIVSVGHVRLAPDMADATAYVSAYPAENLDLVLHGRAGPNPDSRRDMHSHMPWHPPCREPTSRDQRTRSRGHVDPQYPCATILARFGESLLQVARDDGS